MGQGARRWGKGQERPAKDGGKGREQGKVGMEGEHLYEEFIRLAETRLAQNTLNYITTI